jgi:hypothetical protein
VGLADGYTPFGVKVEKRENFRVVGHFVEVDPKFGFCVRLGSRCFCQLTRENVVPSRAR